MWSWRSPAAAGSAFLLAAGIGVVVWQLVQTDGDASPSPVADLRTAEPFQSDRVNWPSGRSSPEDTIHACLQTLGWLSSLQYFGPCDTGLSVEHLKRRATPGYLVSRDFAFSICSRWEDGEISPRSYVTAIGDNAMRLVIERRREGWTVTRAASCSAAGATQPEFERIAAGLSLSPVEPDDCGFAPLPLARPTLRVGP